MTAAAASTDRDPGELRRARFHETNAVLGMTIFVASWAMLFAGLFFAYGVTRLRTPVWPPTDLPQAPLGLPALATAVLALSSLLLQRALGMARQGRRGAVLVGSSAAAGAVFLALQTTVWRDLWLGGLRPETGTYASVFYGLTVFHAVHVLVGLFALAWLAVAPRPTVIGLRLWTLYWHMVGVIWAVMFVLVYLV